MYKRAGGQIWVHCTLRKLPYGEKFYVLNEVCHMKLLRTIVHRFDQTAANILKIVNIIVSSNNLLLSYDEETSL
jgi:hypothetical protein